MLSTFSAPIKNIENLDINMFKMSVADSKIDMFTIPATFQYVDPPGHFENVQ